MALLLYQPRAFELRDRLLRDLRLAALDTDVDEPPVQPGSDWFLLATALDTVMLQSFTNVAAAEQAHDVFAAQGDDLDNIRKAEGLPEILASGARGKIRITVLGATTIVNGSEGTYPNGLRWRTVGAVVNPADQSEIDVEAIDTGENTNLKSGEKVRFATAPTNVAEEAVVSSSEPLTGGDDGESDARKRDRILNVRRNRPAGGNWGQLRQWGIDALGVVQDAYNYPALGGPGSCKVVLIREFEPSIGDYSRELTAAQTQVVRTYIQTKMGIPQEVVVQTVADQDLDVTILVTLPDSALSGGNGQGWTDPDPWPPSSGPAVVITDPGTSNDAPTISADTTVSPVAGQTHIAWWSSVDRKFRTRLVIGVTGGTGAWVVTLESPLIGDTGAGPQVGDYVSPAAFNLETYGDAWVQLLQRFGPGENTSDAGRLPRAKRHPYVTDEDPTDITNTTLAQWSNGYPEAGDSPAHAGFPEITGFELGQARVDTVVATTPTVPTTVDDPPNVLVPRHFAIYPQS
jgi:uncharacterized phage protein gp47/JayE